MRKNLALPAMAAVVTVCLSTALVIYGTDFIGVARHFMETLSLVAISLLVYRKLGVL